MIGPSGVVRVLLATRPVDFRKGADGLAVLLRDALGTDPFSGTVYVFRSKRADRVKLLFWDGSGVVLVAKRRRAAHGGAALGAPGRAELEARAQGS
ncbi:IS66 family insertion sequence element accessory protein TnpB [Methylobacterium sp. Gmos1]